MSMMRQNLSVTQKKILLVEDDAGFKELVSDYFTSAGFGVSSTDNLEEAVKLFRRYRPRVVLLDFQMPGATGDKFLPEFQAVDPHVKVIVLSGHLYEEVEGKFKGLGYYAYFEKGTLSLDKLRKKVDEALEG